MAPAAKEKKQRTALDEVVTRDYTIHLHKHVHGRCAYTRFLPLHSSSRQCGLTQSAHFFLLVNSSFKKVAPTAIKAIRTFAQKHMGTKDVRIDPRLNKAVWATGVKSVPHRMRLRLSRKRNDEEGATEKLYTVVSHVQLPHPLTKSNRSGTWSMHAMSTRGDLSSHSFALPAGVVTQTVDE